MAPSKILAIKLRAMGDTVLLTAPLLELHRLFPQSKIHVLIPTPWASLLQGLPGIDKIWTYDRPSSAIARARSIARLGYALRKEKFDQVLNFHASPSSAALALATGARTRSIHFHGHRAKNKYSTVVIPGKGILKPIIERDMDTVRAVGVQIPAGISPQVNLYPSEIQEAQTLLKKLKLTSPVLGINLGASRPTKSWPIDRFASLAVEWCLKENGSVLALAGPAETQLTLSFLKSVDDHLNTVLANSKKKSAVREKITALDNLSIRLLASTLSQLSVVAGNDSGPKHLAIAVGTPTVTLFGPEHPFEWHPYPGERHPFLFIDNLPCRKDADPGYPAWCGLTQCTIEEHKCMKKIGVESVLKQCQAVARRAK